MEPNEELRSTRETARDKGYVQGVVSENERQARVQNVRENDSAVSGLMVGIILAALVGLGFAAVYFLNRPERAPITAPLIVPVPSPNQPSPTVTPNINITVPPQPAPEPAPATVPQPNNINITVPPQKESTPTQPTPTPQSSSTPQPSTSPN